MMLWLYTVLAVLLATVFVVRVVFPNFVRDLFIMYKFMTLAKIMKNNESFLICFKNTMRTFSDRPAMIHALTGEEISYCELEGRSKRYTQVAMDFSEPLWTCCDTQILLRFLFHQFIIL